ncbi:hypothetical protein TNCV_4007761 [Trichonephila clavipes]|nr:hypothetical protein TNCV_4007761 [Trichonephila clavipes]
MDPGAVSIRGLLRISYASAGNPQSGKSRLDEPTQLDYHGEGVLHGYWTSEASTHGIWLPRCFLESTHTQRRESSYWLLRSEDNG